MLDSNTWRKRQYFEERASLSTHNTHLHSDLPEFELDDDINSNPVRHNIYEIKDLAANEDD